MKSRRQFIRQGSLAATALLAIKPFEGIAQYHRFLNSPFSAGNHLTILHTSHINGQLLPVADSSAYAGLGGCKQTAKLIDAIKSVSTNTLLLDNGNFISPNQESGSFESMVALIKNAGYDLMIAGNNEKLAIETAAEQKGQLSKLPNLDQSTQPYQVLQKGNIRIGIIAPADSIATINRFASRLHHLENCQLIIALSTLGFENNQSNDQILAAQSEYIDIIIGNDANRFMKTPVVAQNKNKKEVVINHIGKSGIVLGRIDIAFDEKGNKKELVFDNLMIGTAKNRWKKITA